MADQSLWQNRISPYREGARIQGQLDRLLDSFWGGNFPMLAPQGDLFQPPCDIDETDSHYLMSFELPGLKKEDIKLEIDGDVLRVSGERKYDQTQGKGSRKQSERYYGMVERAITLPSNVKHEGVETHFENAILHVAVPKAEVMTPRRIHIEENKPGFVSKFFSKKEKGEKAA